MNHGRSGGPPRRAFGLPSTYYGRAVDPLQLLVTNDFLRALDLLGVFIMGVAAGALASRLDFDVVGFAIIGIVAGLGGGLVRDLILDYGVPAAFDSPAYLACALAGSAFSFLISSEGAWWRHLVTVLDIAAMALWAATGTAKSFGYGLEPLPAVLLGVTSAVGGGVIRDVLVGRIPAIFGGGPIYATGALLTAVGTWSVVALGLPAPTVLIAVAMGALLAGVAAWRRWSLPAHGQWQVTMSASQLKALVRRARKDERRRVALETGTIPVVASDGPDTFAEDALGEDDSLEDYTGSTLGSDEPVEGIDNNADDSPETAGRQHGASRETPPGADPDGDDDGADGPADRR